MRTAVSLAQAAGAEVSRISLIANYLHEISCHNLVATLITGKRTCKMKTAEKLRHHVVLKRKVKTPKENDILKNRKNSTKNFFQYCTVRCSTLSCFLYKKSKILVTGCSYLTRNYVTRGYVYARTQLVSPIGYLPTPFSLEPLTHGWSHPSQAQAHSH